MYDALRTRVAGACRTRQAVEGNGHDERDGGRLVGRVSDDPALLSSVWRAIRHARRSHPGRRPWHDRSDRRWLGPAADVFAGRWAADWRVVQHPDTSDLQP